eukprot:m.253233 g.253233  ORF g.253233 m.253233 type:complete len:493 (+) comp18232_c0_seq1:45-1523(+)
MAGIEDDRTWDPLHIQNEQDRYCVCGGPWDSENFMAHCSVCKDWFHEACMEALPTKLLPGLVNYSYVCKACSGGTEQFARKDGGFKCALLTTLGALTARHTGTTPPVFSVKKDIMRFIDEYWEVLSGTGKQKPKQWTTVGTTLMQDSTLFVTAPDTQRSTTGAYGLSNTNPRWLSPNVHGALLVDVAPPSTKRKADEPAAGRRRERRVEGELPVQAQAAYPFNKDGYRYVLAEKVPGGHADEFRYACNPGPVSLSQQDRAPQLRLSEDRLTVTGEKGYCSVLASTGVNHGRWYYEATVLPGERLVDRPEPHVRIGWSLNISNLQGPCGFERSSYAWRDTDGSKFHQAKGAPYAAGFAAGDVLGLGIELPHPPSGLLPRRTEKETLIVYKQMVFYESKDAADKNALKPLKGARITAFKNGVPQGVMFEDIVEGTYYPAVALYMGAQVQFNFGPDFACPPPPGYRPMCDALHTQNAGFVLADIIDKIEAKTAKK